MIIGPVSHTAPFARSKALILPPDLPEDLQSLVVMDHKLGMCRFDGVREFYINYPKDGRAFISAARYAVIGATALGDTGMFNCILADVAKYPRNVKHPQAELAASVFHSWLRQWLKIPDDGVCERLRSVDPEQLPDAWRSHLHYSLLGTLMAHGELMAAYALAVGELFYTKRHAGESLDETWLMVVCALANRDDGRPDDELVWFGRAVDAAGKAGYALPFLGIMLGSGSMLEKALAERSPAMLNVVREHTNGFHRGRIRLRNAYTGGAAAECLTMREFYLAAQLARGMRYKSLAKRMGITPGRLKNIALQVHEKLHVHTKKELARFVW